MSVRSEVIRVINDILGDSKKISQLEAAVSVNPTDEMEINQGGVSKKATITQIASGGSGLTVAFWNFAANGGNFPTTSTALFISEDEHGTIGDPDYVPQDAWFVANTASPSGYSDFSFKF